MITIDKQLTLIYSELVMKPSGKRMTIGTFKCYCGKEFKTTPYKVRIGHTKSCGCSRKDGTHITHGDSNSSLYRRWAEMRRRCSDTEPKKRTYNDYFLRGIRVCPEWNDYAVFREWALNNGFSKELSIDRVNNDGNYEPSNCRWTTILIQNNNRRPKSGTKGVYFIKGRWRVQMTCNHKYYFFGAYRSEEIAKAVYTVARAKLLKEKALYDKDMPLLHKGI